MSGDNLHNGGAYLIYGSAARLTGSHPIDGVGAFLRDATPCTEAGAVAGLGDIDGDGKADFAIGRASVPGGAAEVLVFYGRDARLSGTLDLAATADATIRGTPAIDALPAMMPAGDFDGDGLPDFVVGLARSERSRDVGLVRGSATRLAGVVALDAVAQLQLPGDDSCGEVVFGAALGDLDRDGADDLTLASCEYRPGVALGVLVHRVFYGHKGGCRLGSPPPTQPPR